MKNLIYKEVAFSINKFFYLLPFLLSLLMFIPNWIFSLVFMYFFWVSVSQIVVAYTTQADYAFLSMLPVTKKEIVTSKISAFIIVELIHILFGLIFGIIHNVIYGPFNFFMNINPAFFGIVFMTFGIFNIIFLPLYFKTAYKFGKPVIYGIIITLLFGGFFEYSAVAIPMIRNFLKSADFLIQYGVLFCGIIVYILLNIVSVNRSTKNFENIK